MDDINLLWMPGGGGHWLMHVVYCLQTNSEPIALKRGEKYDDVNEQSKNLTKAHHIRDISPPTPNAITLLSTRNLFNIAITDLDKNPGAMSEFSDIDSQMFERVTSDAWYQMHDNEYNIDITLDHDWIYNDREKFIHALYDVLDTHGIPYLKNDNIVKQAIRNYINSNTLVYDHFGNYESWLWLGWCHATLMSLDIVIDKDLSKCVMSEIVEIIYPYNDICSEKIREFIIPGTLNE